MSLSSKNLLGGCFVILHCTIILILVSNREKLRLQWDLPVTCQIVFDCLSYLRSVGVSMSLGLQKLVVYLERVAAINSAKHHSVTRETEQIQVMRSF